MSEITEVDLFNAILDSERLPEYDPALHLSADVCSKAWKVDKRSALIIMRRKAEEYGAKMITVRHPKTGKRILVLAKG